MSILLRSSRPLIRLSYNLIPKRCIASSRCHWKEHRDDYIKFSGSPADWEPSATFVPRQHAPWYQAYSVLFSLAAFMLYFLVLREENDIDDWLFSNIYLQMDPSNELRKLEKRLADEKAADLDTTVTESKIRAVTSFMNSNPQTVFKERLKEIEGSKKK